MIHRAPFGSMERFIGVLIEHFAGAFPTWLAPVQVAVLSISEKFSEYANKVQEALKAAGLRVELSDGPDKIGAKIRNATLAKVPYMLIVGEQEASAGKVAVRHRTLGDQGAVPLEEFIARVKEEVTTRAASAK
jgi:threonyl-tRNA synthetase